MAGGSNGCRAALVRRQLTPGLISSLPGTAGLPPFISFSTSYPELDSALHRRMALVAYGTSRQFIATHQFGRYQSEADMPESVGGASIDENDP